MQHDWKPVERPGESHTALDGKKESIRTLGSVKLVGVCLVQVNLRLCFLVVLTSTGHEDRGSISFK